MRTLLRRLRGLLGVGLTWGTVWAVLGAALGVVVGVVFPASVDPGETPLEIAWILGIAGFVSGSGYALVLSQLERGRSLRDVSLWRAALWGAAGAALVPLIGPAADSMVFFTCPLGGLLAAGSFAIARRTEPPRLGSGASSTTSVVTLSALLLSSTSCGAGWKRTEVAPGHLAPRQQVELWRGGKVTRWHAVQISADTISAIPFLSPITCDTCRVRLPRAAVDSMRLGDPVGGFFATAALVLAVPLAILVVACIAAGHFPYCFPGEMA